MNENLSNKEGINDVIGQPIYVDSPVILSFFHYKELCVGRVIKICPKSVRVEFRGRKKLCYGNELHVISEEIYNKYFEYRKK
jgi:hypothetical protein